MRFLKEITWSNRERSLHEISTGEHRQSAIILEMQGWHFMKMVAGIQCQEIYPTHPQQRPRTDAVRLESVGTHVTQSCVGTARPWALGPCAHVPLFPVFVNAGCILRVESGNVTRYNFPNCIAGFTPNKLQYFFFFFFLQEA